MSTNFRRFSKIHKKMLTGPGELLMVCTQEIWYLKLILQKNRPSTIFFFI